MSTDKQQQTSAAVNPFGVVSCARPKTVGVYPNRNGQSTAAIECVVPIGSLGVMLAVTIWGRMTRTNDGHEITFAAGLPKGFSKDDSENSDKFLAYVEKAAMSWVGYDAAMKAAHQRLVDGPKVAGASSIRPRLVYTPEGDAARAANGGSRVNAH